MKQLLMFAAGLYAAAALAGESSFEYKGVALGESEAAFSKAHPFFSCEAASSARRCVLAPEKCASAECRRQATYGGVPVTRITARFEKGALNAVSVRIAAPRFQELYGALVARFGEPNVTGGAAIWDRPGGVLQARRTVPDEPGMSSVTIVSRGALDAALTTQTTQKAATHAAGAKDL